MAKNKTTETTKSVADFLKGVADETKRKDCLQIIEIMKQQTGFEPKLWGPSIIGFGSYHYKYETGREGDMPLLCFSPRSSSIALYLSANFEKREDLLEKLGKYKSDKACIHIKKLEEIDLNILKKMFVAHVKHVKNQHPDLKK